MEFDPKTGSESSQPFTAEERQEIRRLARSSRRKWRVITVWIIVFSLVVFFGVSQNRQRSKEGQEAHDGLCALKGNLERRVEAADEILSKSSLSEKVIDVDPGPEKFLISRDLLITSRNRDNESLNAMSGVECNKEEKKQITTSEGG